MKLYSILAFGILAIAYCPAALCDDVGATEEQVRSFGMQVAEAIEISDAASIRVWGDTRIDVRDMVGGVEFFYQDKEKWMDLLQQRVDILPPLHEKLIHESGEVSSCRLIEVEQAESRWKIVLRLLLTNETLTYLLLEVEPDDQQALKIKRIHDLHLGEQWRDFLKVCLTKYAPWEGEDGKISDQAQNAKLISAKKSYAYGITRAYRVQNHLAAVRYYHQMPPAVRDLQKEPFIAANALRSALELHSLALNSGNIESELEALRTIHLVNNRCPDSPGIALLSLHHVIDLGLPDKALQLLKVLRATVGDDPFLKLYEAHARFDKGENQRGGELIGEALDGLEDISEAYLLAGLIYSGTNQFTKAIETLDKVETQFGLTIRPEKSWGPDWSSLIQSDEYKHWIESKANS